MAHQLGNPIHLIALSGKMHAGKDTVADIIRLLIFEQDELLDQRRYKLPVRDALSDAGIVDKVLNMGDLRVNTDAFCRFKIKRFAGPVKEIASMITGIPIGNFEDQQFKETFLGPEWDKWGVQRDAGKYGPGAWFGSEQELRESVWFNSTPLVQDSFDEPGKIITREQLIIRAQRRVRSLLQDIGTGAMRDVIHPNVWVNALFSHWKTITSPNSSNEEVGLDVVTEIPQQHWLITDLRFPNELQAVERHGGLTIRVIRPGHDSGSTHPSETALDKASFQETIINDGSLEDLVGKVRGLLHVYGLLS